MQPIVSMPYIGGERVSGHETVEVCCPADRELVAVFETASAAQVDAAVRTAEHAFEQSAWREMHPRQRARILHRIADEIEAEVADLARIDALCTGRLLRELAPQVGRLPEWFRYFAGLIEGSEGSVFPFLGPYLSYAERVPIGVVAQIVTWNHPLLLLVKKLAPAIATGNCVVVKPSELTPVTAVILAEICDRAGLPPGVLNVVPGLTPTATALVSHPRIGKVDFTGGTETGQAIARAAAENLTPTTLELGGKTPVIVFDDVDVDRAVAGALFAAFVASGQTCVSGARILIQQGLYDRFVERFTERAVGLRLGHPLDPQAQIGSLVSERQRERVLSDVTQAINDGAECLAGGGIPELPRPLSEGAFFEPTVFVNVSPDMAIWNDEVFGPVVTINPFGDEDEAVALANNSRFALGASIWTGSVARAHRIARRLQAGVIWVNDHHRNDPSSPWGGFKASGYGRENGWESIRSYTAPRTVMVNLSDEPFDWFDQSAGPKRYG